MILGFTGTRHGMSIPQITAVRARVAELAPSAVHHGDCVGADEQFHRLIVQDAPNALITIHPPTVATYRAFCDGDVVLPTQPYIKRNHNIVDTTQHLLAATNTTYDVPRSGTWSTVRYAIRTGKPITIVYPDGQVIELPALPPPSAQDEQPTP